MESNLAQRLKPMSEAAPFSDRRGIRFGETDAARIVYSVRFFDYAIDAIDAWYESVAGISLYDLNMGFDISCPFVHAELDFQSPLRPGDDLATQVLVDGMGRSTLHFAVRGHAGRQREVFTGRFSLSFIAPSRMKSIPVPEPIAQRVSLYQQRCAEAAAA